MKILLSVCGSISAYKSFDIARGLVNNGHEVKVILTKGALKFVVPEVYTYLGASDVFLDQDDFKNKNVLHVELARWSDSLVIAPLSANTISRLARGEASDLLTSVFLAFEDHKPILLFPAMNTMMLNHPFTQENMAEIKKLKTLKNVFISETNCGVLACNEEGAGKLPTVDEVLALVPVLRAPFDTEKERKKIVISTGATMAPLDPVRFLTNSSSGITGYHFARAALFKGHRVTVVAGKNACAELDLLKKHPLYDLRRVVTVEQMKNAVHEEIKNAHAYISAAAISDIEFDLSAEKIKKDQIGDSLKIKRAADVLRSVLETKTEQLKVVGFAAETNISDDVLTKKFNSKPVDLLVATKVNNGLSESGALQGFNLDHAIYRFMQKDQISQERALSKSELADIVLERIKL